MARKNRERGWVGEREWKRQVTFICLLKSAELNWTLSYNLHICLWTIARIISSTIADFCYATFSPSNIIK